MEKEKIKKYRKMMTFFALLAALNLVMIVYEYNIFYLVSMIICILFEYYYWFKIAKEED